MSRAVRTTHAVILSGGVAHDFAATSHELTRLLTEVGIEARTSQDVDAELTALPPLGPDADASSGRGRADVPSLVVLNMLRWTMDVERYADQRAQWSISLSEPARTGLQGFVEAGGGLLGVHGASICFDDWPGWRNLLGGAWRWESSFHPPLDGPVRIDVNSQTPHPIVSGAEDFEVVDEAYGFLDVVDDVQPLLSTEHSGAVHPVMWARSVGSGRVVYDALGHDVRSFTTIPHRRILQRAARWVSRLL